MFREKEVTKFLFEYVGVSEKSATGNDGLKQTDLKMILWTIQEQDLCPWLFVVWIWGKKDKSCVCGWSSSYVPFHIRHILSRCVSWRLLPVTEMWANWTLQLIPDTILTAIFGTFTCCKPMLKQFSWEPDIDCQRWHKRWNNCRTTQF